MKKLYHVSKPKFREAIQAQGIQPKVGVQRAGKHRNNTPLIFATNAKGVNDLFNSTFDDDVWEIDISKAHTDWKLDPMYKEKIHYVSSTPVPVSALKLIYKGSGRDMEYIDKDAMNAEEIAARAKKIDGYFKGGLVEKILKEAQLAFDFPAASKEEIEKHQDPYRNPAAMRKVAKIVGTQNQNNKLPTLQEFINTVYDTISGASEPPYRINEDGEEEVNSYTKDEFEAICEDEYGTFEWMADKPYIDIYRVIETTKINFRMVGNCWSFEKDSAIMFGKQNLSGKNPVQLLQGKVKPGNVDWDATIDAYAVMSFGQLGDSYAENELYIPDGNIIYDIKVINTNVFKKGKWGS
jgi:hypothetical protein